MLLEGSKSFAPPAIGRTLIDLSLCSGQRGKEETSDCCSLGSTYPENTCLSWKEQWTSIWDKSINNNKQLQRNVKILKALVYFEHYHSLSSRYQNFFFFLNQDYRRHMGNKGHYAWLLHWANSHFSYQANSQKLT